MSNDKKCRKCGETDELKLVLNDTRMTVKNGLTHYYYCRACDSVRKIKYNQSHKNKVYSLINESHKRNRVKHYARCAVYKALKTNKITKQDCVCGDKNTQAHHEDYSKPLQIIWLCKNCHENLHKKKSLLVTI